MSSVSVIIPSRNEQFLTKTIRDLLDKAQGDIEVIAALEGYWPDEVVDDPRVVYSHSGSPRGMRGAINAGVRIASGDFVMKCDAHCMFGEGYDVILSEACEPNWVCVPTRYRLEPESWTREEDRPEDNRRPINYLYLKPDMGGMDVVEWRQKNDDASFDILDVDDIFTMQGSCYFLPKDLYHELELLDEAHYGTFRKDPQEVSFKAWCSGGRTVRVKRTWYAHLHKGKKYERGYGVSRRDWRKGDRYVLKWWQDEAWSGQTLSFKWLCRKFGDMPGWENFDWASWETRLC